MTKLNFKISEFNISGKPIPQDIADKILEYHILPMQSAREELGYSMTASKKSGYRSREWELAHKRNGTSQHCFIGKGAVDWTCEDFKDNKNDFLEAIIKHTSYIRMAVYSGFIHCDYKETEGNKRQVFSSTAKSVWTFIRFVD
jgi:hypothetical protein